MDPHRSSKLRDGLDISFVARTLHIVGGQLGLRIRQATSRRHPCGANTQSKCTRASRSGRKAGPEDV